MPNIHVRGRTGGDEICSFCRGPIAGTQPLPCPECQALYHPDCARAHGACATLGCNGLRTAASLARERLSEASQVDQKGGGWGHLGARRKKAGPTTPADVVLALAGVGLWTAFGYFQGVFASLPEAVPASVSGAGRVMGAVLWGGVLLALVFGLFMALSGLRRRRAD